MQEKGSHGEESIVAIFEKWWILCWRWWCRREIFTKHIFHFLQIIIIMCGDTDCIISVFQKFITIVPTTTTIASNYRRFIIHTVRGVAPFTGATPTGVGHCGYYWRASVITNAVLLLQRCNVVFVIDMETLAMVVFQCCNRAAGILLADTGQYGAFVFNAAIVIQCRLANDLELETVRMASKKRWKRLSNFIWLDDWWEIL